jgi:prepilin-type N-terminal cleavage/methylation domain-containing protein
VNPAARGARRGTSGFTVVELTVVILVLGIVTASVYALLNVTRRSERTQEALVNNQEAVRLAMVEMAKDLRSADPLQTLSSVSDYQNGFDASLTPASGSGTDTVVRWRLSGTTLTRSILSGVGGTVTSSKTVLTNVRNISKNVPMLRYYNSNGAEITTSSTAADYVNCTIRVHMTITADSDPGPLPFTQNSDVQVRNRLPGGLGC